MLSSLASFFTALKRLKDCFLGAGIFCIIYLSIPVFVFLFGCLVAITLPFTLLFHLVSVPIGWAQRIFGPAKAVAPVVFEETEGDKYYRFPVKRDGALASKVLDFITFLNQSEKIQRHSLPRLVNWENQYPYPKWPDGKRHAEFLFYETKLYKISLNNLPEAPQEAEDLKRAMRYFGESVFNNYRFCQPHELAIDMDLLWRACELRLQRAIRVQFKRMSNTVPSTIIPVEKDFWKTTVFPGAVYRAVFIEAKRRQRPYGFANRQPERSAFITPWDKDLFSTLKSVVATNEERSRFFENMDSDFYRIARNKWVEKNDDWLRRYFIAYEQSGSLGDFSSNKNIRRRTLEWLEEIGRPTSKEELQHELREYIKERGEFIHATKKNDQEIFFSNRSDLRVLRSPEELRYFEQWYPYGRKVKEEELDLQNIVYGLVERLFFEHMITFDEILMIQDIMDGDSSKQGSLEALRLLKLFLER